MNKKPYIFIIAALLVILFDQLTKLSMVKYQKINLIGEFFKFEFSKNYGAGFSLLQGYTDLLIWFSVIVIGLIIYYYDKMPKKTALCFSFILGGAIGNLIDRISYGYVIDFVDINVWHGYFLNIYWKIWPSFNIADLAVFIGVIGLIAYYWKK